MIFGGLEIVAGGYLIHRHYKRKDAKKRQEDELEARRHNTFPGAGKSPSHLQQQQYQQRPAVAPQKYACYGTPQPQVQQQSPYPAQPHVQPRPGPPQHAQTFNIPRRPVPERKQPQIIIEPSLQRTDSFATLSRMPVANGYRPHDVPEDPPIVPPRRHASGGLSPATATQHGVYGNAGFSVSTPAFGATATSPDDNWEAYGYSGTARPHYAPTEASTQLGERDPPPPYTP
ncbi:hypothetical protein HBH75_026640 [Parastagonospora nodorum]|nr:hypothetical protein HBH75_026640 [Parastagonospora nodorum]